jgi:type 1 glutamine amidotransferase
MKKKAALIVWGGWAGHEPEQCAKVFADWLAEEGFRVDVSDTLDAYLNKRKMKNYSVIVPCVTMAAITSDQSKGLRKAVMEGVGLASFHGGMGDSFRNDTEYQFMTGGQFVAHPGGIIQYRVRIIDKKDPIMKGIKDFNVQSEQYYMHVDPGNKVLATTTFSGRHDGVNWIKGTLMPVVWKRRYGKGRVFYSALGHVAKEFEKREVFEIMKRGIVWASR